MEEKYWNIFMETGKIADYLYYRGIEICRQAAERRGGDTDSEPDYIDGHGDRVSAGRRV